VTVIFCLFLLNSSIIVFLALVCGMADTTASGVKLVVWTEGLEKTLVLHQVAIAAHEEVMKIFTCVVSPHARGWGSSCSPWLDILHELAILHELKLTWRFAPTNCTAVSLLTSPLMGCWRSKSLLKGDECLVR
jgi:hypothetical protein